MECVVCYIHIQLVMDGKAWHAAVHGVAKRRHDWETELIYTSIWSNMSFKAKFPIHFLSG